MSGRPSALFLAALIAIAPGPVTAQRFAVDVRGAVAMPRDLLATSPSTGGGIGATLAYQVMPHLALYAGWDWMQFGTDSGYGGVEADLNETGYTFGLRFEHPFTATSTVRYRLEGGGTYKHVEVEKADGALVFDTGHGLGFEAAAGLVVPIGRGLRLVPAVRYRALRRDYVIGATTSSADLRYVAVEGGVSWRF